MLPKSIRWQLPLSYAAIALLAAIALGLALILPLRSYYVELERDYLNRNAREIGLVMSRIAQSSAAGSDANAQAKALAFLTQARVRVFDAGRQLVLDSGPVASRSLVALPPRLTRPARPARPSPPSAEIGFPAEAAAPFITQTAPFTGLFNLEAERADLWGDVLFAFVVADSFGASLDVTTPGQPVTGTSLFINRSLYGFDVGSEVRSDERRSDQVAEQPYFNDAGQMLGYVELSEGPAYGRDIVENVARGWVVASAIAVLIAAGAGLVISRRISAPLAALTQVTSRMAHGELSARADVRRKDELGTLARSFNEMADRVEGTVTTLRQFASDAAHEINTPLTALRTRLDLAERDGDPDDVREARQQAARLEQLTSGLLDLSRIESGEASGSSTARQWIDLVQLVRAASEPFASRGEQHGVAFTLDLPAPAQAQAVNVVANEDQLRRAVDNLLDNAVKFTPSGGTITLTIRENGQRAEVVVEDTGIGIPTDELPRLFERFHRASNAAAYPGNGLGLAMVKIIVEQHGGEVRAENMPHGARFSFWLPLSA